jgi:Aspartyl protease
MIKTRAGTLQLADALFRAGRLAEAIAAYEAVLRDRREDAAVLRRLGDLALCENRPEDAVRYLGQALELGSAAGRRWPASATTRAKLGMAHYRLDCFPEAAREFAAAAGPLPLGPLGHVAGLARHLAAFGDDPPYRIEGPPLTRLDFVVTDPLPVVELSVNGGPPALFLIDTGAAETVLDEAFAAAAGAEMVAAMKGEYAGRRRARTGLGRVESIEAADLRVAGVPIHTLDLGDFHGFFGLDIKGIVGTRLLMHFLATIDYPAAALILRRDPPGTRPARGIPFWLVETHLILARGRLNDLPPSFFWVDTGLAGSGFLASEAQLRAAGVHVDWSAARLGPGGGGRVREVGVVIDSVTIGEGDAAIRRDGLRGTVLEKAPSILGDRLGFEVGGLISHAFFRQHALTLDFANMTLLLDPPPGT